MNNKLKIFLIIISLLAIGGFAVWTFINKPTTDYSKKNPEYTFTFTDLIKRIETDTTQIKNKLIAVNGPIKKIIRDSSNIVLEVGYDSIMSSVTCQIDSRYIADLKNIEEGKNIDIKGIVSDISIDAESVFGSTIQMTYCSLNKK